MNNTTTTTGLDFTESRMLDSQKELDQLEQMDNESLIEQGMDDSLENELSF